MDTTDNPVTEETMSKLKRMEAYIDLALQNGDQAQIKNGYQLEITFLRPVAAKKGAE